MKLDLRRIMLSRRLLALAAVSLANGSAYSESLSTRLPVQTQVQVEAQVQPKLIVDVEPLKHAMLLQKELSRRAALLSLVEAYDDNGESVRIENLSTADPAVKKCYVNPEADKLTFTSACGEGQRLHVNGVKYANGADVTIKRDKTRHTQVVEVIPLTCLTTYSMLHGRASYADTAPAYIVAWLRTQ